MTGRVQITWLPALVVVLPDNGREFCGREDRDPYDLLLQLEGIGHKRTYVSRQQSNGFVERPHRASSSTSIPASKAGEPGSRPAELQIVLDAYLIEYNTMRPHQGRGMNGRTPSKAFIDGIGKENSAQTKQPRKAA